jgi:single-stranded DNA-binding protein
MASFANISIVGNMGDDLRCGPTPIRPDGSGGVMNCQVSIAVNNPPFGGRQRNPDEEPVWYRITIWGQQCDGAMKLADMGAIGKGISVFAAGTLTGRYYDNQNTGLRHQLSLEVNTTQFGPAGNAPVEYQDGTYGRGQNYVRPQNGNAQRPNFPNKVAIVAGSLSGQNQMVPQVVTQQVQQPQEPAHIQWVNQQEDQPQLSNHQQVVQQQQQRPLQERVRAQEAPALDNV